MAAAQAEVACLKVESSKYQKDALMEVSCLQAQAKAAERKVDEVTEEVAAAKAMSLSEYQSSAEFEQVCGEQ